MALDVRLQAMLTEMHNARDEMRDIKSHVLKSGGGGGTSDGMDSRVTKLETHMEYVRSDLSEIKGDLKTVVSRLNDLPTKKDLDTWRWQWMGIGIAIVALTVGGITGGLALISKFAS